MTLYNVEESLRSGWLLREPADEAPLAEQVRKLLDVVDQEQAVLPDWLRAAFAPWLVSTRRWVDDPASAADDERLREVLERLRAYRSLVALLVHRHDGE